MLPSQRLYLEAIAETYKNAGSWDTRRQILSIMTATASFSTKREFIPGLSQYRYAVANLHRLQHGVATPVPVQPSARIRIDEAQLDHFLQFITSPHMFQDMPFGLKNLRLSKCNGNVLEVPNVIQCLIPERFAVQYEQYCKEVEFTPFSKRTPLRVLAACGTTVRKSLQGLDYFAADGASAFDKMISLLNQLKRPG